jgi:hypothetical protein
MGGLGRLIDWDEVMIRGGDIHCERDFQVATAAKCGVLVSVLGVCCTD